MLGHSISEFMTIKALLSRNKHRKVVVTEFSGNTTLLLDDRQIIINEEETFDLAKFLTVYSGQYATIRRVRVSNLNELFDNDLIRQRWNKIYKNDPRSDKTDKLSVSEDGVLMIGDKTLYDFFWDDKGGMKRQYNYIEIYIVASNVIK